MQSDAFFVIHLIFTGLFLATLLAGVWLFKNQQRLFGRDPAMPSENSSSHTYSRLQAFVIWAHAVVLTGAFALLLH